MSRPPLEVADLIRAAGQSFIEHSHLWLTDRHRKVLTAIERCRTAALGGHVDECSRCGHRAISYNSCLMESIFEWGVRPRNRRWVGLFGRVRRTATHHNLNGLLLR
jgi:transposase-like zinc-binding protein